MRREVAVGDAIGPIKLCDGNATSVLDGLPGLLLPKKRAPQPPEGVLRRNKIALIRLGSISLPAQEGRDVELVVIGRLCAGAGDRSKSRGCGLGVRLANSDTGSGAIRPRANRCTGRGRSGIGAERGGAA